MADEYTISGTIEETRPSKSGKTMGVKVNGVWYSTKSYAVTQHVGQQIEGKCSDSEWNGNTIKWLNEYTLAQGVNPPGSTVTGHAPRGGGGTIETRQTVSAPQAQSQGWTERDKSIVAQSLAKSVLSPDMNDEQIRNRLILCVGLAEEMELWIRMGAPQGGG